MLKHGEIKTLKNNFICSYRSKGRVSDWFSFFWIGDDKYIGALFCIDIFTKYATAIPIKNKQPEELLNALTFAIDEMGGKPKTIYSDNEGSFHSKLLTEYFNNNNIRFLATNTHAAYVERLIRTIKSYIYKRVERYKNHG